MGALPAQRVPGPQTSDALDRFAAELDAIRHDTMAQVGTEDARYIVRLLWVIRGCEAAGRALLLTTPCTVTTDVQMLKRVTDNLLSNIEKYADPAARLTILAECEGERLHVCFANRARRELARVESNHIGLRTCEAILKLLGGQFFTPRAGDDFSAEFVLPLTPPDAAQG